MTERFVPPFPKPHRTRSSMLARFLRGWGDWISVLFEKSYTMKMGEVRMPGLRFYMPNQPALVEQVLADPFAFPKHGMVQDLLEPVTGDSVFSSNGERWQRHRALIGPAFATTNLKRAFGLMQDAIDEAVGRLAAGDLSGPIDVDPFATHLTADIIFRTLFSITVDAPIAGEIYRAFTDYQRNVQVASILRLYRLPSSWFYARAVRAGTRLSATFAPLVRARYDAGAGPDAPQDFLQALIDARDEAGDRFSYKEVVDHAAIFFLAGHETTASAIAWALYLIAEQPHVQARMLAELEGATGGGPLRFDLLRQLPFTRNVFRETLRLYPPIGFLMRAPVRPIRMRDKDVPAGGALVVSPWLMQRNGREWPDPHAFDPDRFDAPEQAEACRHAYLPFGKGPRVCVGAGFATQEAVLTLAAIVRRFRLAYPPGPKPQPISRLTLRPKHGVRLLLALR